MKGLTILFLVFAISIAIAFSWQSFPLIKNSVHALLGPSLGALLDWNKWVGLLMITCVLSFSMVLVQKYGTDQETLKEIRAEQKQLQEEMKKYKDNPEKMLEFNKKQIEIMPQMMKISMRPVLYTMIPFILLFRWFNDYFVASEFKFFGFLSWFWIYFALSIIFSQVFRKVLKTV